MKRNAALRLAYGILMCLAVPLRSWAEPTPEANSAFNAYVASVEARLVQQHRSASVLATPLPDTAKPGALLIERLTPRDSEVSGALLHHWRATAFAPGASAQSFESLLRNFAAYPKYFAPEVLAAKAEIQPDDTLKGWMRVRQKHVLTVVMDVTYNVTLQGNAHTGFSSSRSTHVYEIASPGTSSEHALSAAEEHGFLWRQNTYWSWEQRDGGLYVQVESVSLSRAIPTGFSWALRPFVESVPRESLEFTLRSACNALRATTHSPERKIP